MIKLVSSSKPVIRIFENKKYFKDPKEEKKKPLPSLNQEEASVYLSIIVPAFNEEKRLPTMLNEVLEYLEQRLLQKNSKDNIWSPLVGSKFTYEIIIVDDGSTDNTTKVALDYSLKYGTDKIRVISLIENRGKGGAVRMGVLSSRGQLILFADADGATKFSDIEKLENFVYTTTDNTIDLLNTISIGSRAHLEKDSISSRFIFRTILMYGFHFLVWFFTVKTIRDTQCGFKLFGRNIAKVLFNSIHIETWTFDVELLYLAERLNCNIGEIAVNWKEIEGSKIVPVFSWIRMGKDVLTISFMYTIGAWAIPTSKLIKLN